jgi:hypothetical protein
MSVGQIPVIGRRHGKGLSGQVPPASFAGIAVDYPYSDSPTDLLLCERPHLQCYGIVDSEHWEKAHHDRLMGEDRRVPEYTHLQVSNLDLAREFPFSDKVESEPSNRTELARRTARTSSVEISPAQARSKRLCPKKDRVIAGLKQRGINCKADIGCEFKRLAAEMVPIDSYGADERGVNALTTMLKRLTDADFKTK